MTERGSIIRLFLLSVILTLTFFSLVPGNNNGFISWDDSAYVLENPKIRSLSQPSLIKLLTAKDLGLYTPLTALSFAIEYRFAGNSPVVRHKVNLALHICNTALVFLLILQLGLGTAAAFFISLIFWSSSGSRGIRGMGSGTERHAVFAVYAFIAQYLPEIPADGKPVLLFRDISAVHMLPALKTDGHSISVYSAWN